MKTRLGFQRCRSIMRSCLGFWLLGASAAAMASVPQAAESVAPSRAKLEARVEAVRARLDELDRQSGSTGALNNPPSLSKVAQWYNWSNWGNWGNWRNWGNS